MKELEQIQELQRAASEKGMSFMIITDGNIINISVILLNGRVHSFKIEKDYCQKTKDEIVQRIKNII